MTTGVTTGGLLALHAHPDDETLSTGALLATWAAAGRPVTVVTCTRGEQGEVIPPALRHLEGAGEVFADHREGELAVALEALGVTGHHYLDRLPGWDGPRVVDSGMAWVDAGQAGRAAEVPDGAFVTVPVERAAAALAVLLRELRPDVVVGYEPGGGYGHPDHVHAHAVLMRAVELAAESAPGAPGAQGSQGSQGAPGAPAAREPWEVPVVLWAVLEEARLRAGWAALRAGDVPAGASVPDPDGPVPSAATSAPVDVRVPVRPVAGRLRAAMLAHGTQVHRVELSAEDGAGPVVGRFALSNDVLQPVLAEETYRFASGRPARPVRWPSALDARVP